MVDFTIMTKEQALDALVNLDVALWGETGREAYRAHHAGRSRGRLINSVVYHAASSYGDDFSAAEKRAAKDQLTPADVADLRSGG